MEGEEPDNIWIAISNGDLARVQHLVAREGVSVNVQDDQGYSPMHAAASYNELGAIEFLVNLGADIHIRDNDGDTPLLVAESPAAFELLVQLGADPHAKNHAGEGIIEKIVEDNNSELFDFLVQKGFISDSTMIAQVRSALDAGEDGDNNGAEFNLEAINEDDDNNDDMNM